MYQKYNPNGIYLLGANQNQSLRSVCIHVCDLENMFRVPKYAAIETRTGSLICYPNFHMNSIRSI